MVRFAALLLILAVIPCDLAADEEAQLESTRRTEVAALAAAKARQVEMLVGDKQDKAELHKEPLLRWSNPTAGSVHGEVYLWSLHNRPVAIASIYRWYHPFKDSTFEVASLSPLKVEARENKQQFWE